MSDEEREEFSISDRDLQSAFNPTRRRGRQSKEEATYGIWSTQAERANTRPKSSSSMYNRGSQPISFVSGGVKLGEKTGKQQNTTKPTGSQKKPILIDSYNSDEDSDEKLDGDYDDEDEVEIIESKRKKRKDSSDEVDSDDEEEQAEGNQAARSSDEDIEPPITQRQPPNVQYQRPPPMKSAPVRDKEFGAFEKHTKGFGMKMLKKFGYQEGLGLGRDLQGRALPIQVVKREGKGAVGRYGNEDPNRAASSKGGDDGDSNKSSKKKAEPAGPQWRRQPREKAPKQQYQYRTLGDLLKDQTTKFQKNKSGNAAGAAAPLGKIIDMTGREKRILQNYDSLATKHHYAATEQEQIFSLEELTHNLDLVIESCEESMIKSHRRRKFDEDTTVALKYDLASTEQTLSNEETEMNRLNLLLSMIDRCEQRARQVHNIADLFFLQTVFDELKRNYLKEYQKYRLWDLAVPVLHSHLKQHVLAQWNVLQGDHEHDQQLIDLFTRWKSVLEDDAIDLTAENSVPSKETMDPYHRLVWDVWMPILRKAMLEWNPRQPDRLIDCLDRWLPCLPRWIVDNILDQLIFPVLNREVEAWNPLTDPIPIHSWLHPWLPLMDDRLEPLYQPIRTKLAQALQSWQPSDASAKAVLLPWKGVFKQGTWDAFMNKHIVPKLITVIQQFIIDPRQQVLDPWHWFIAWHDVVPLPSMIAILEKSFFPQWHQVLNAWLNTNPNYQEIQRWYSGWRSLIPGAIINHTVIKEKLTEGLMMIDRRISGPSINTAPPPTAPQPAVNVNYEAIYNRGVATSGSAVISSFKDLVERKAAEHNLLFLPILNRTFEGKQVYRFGSANIYIDKSVLFLFDNGQWIPLRLNDLVARAV